MARAALDASSQRVATDRKIYAVFYSKLRLRARHRTTRARYASWVRRLVLPSHGARLFRPWRRLHRERERRGSVGRGGAWPRRCYAAFPFESSVEGLGAVVDHCAVAYRPGDRRRANLTGAAPIDVARLAPSPDIEKVYTTAATRAGCSRFLDKELPRASVIDVRSPVVAAALAAEEQPLRRSCRTVQGAARPSRCCATTWGICRT